MIRRKFLKLLGLGVAATPAMASQAYGQKYMPIGGMLSSGLSSESGIAKGFPGTNTIISMSNYLDVWGVIPKFQLDRLKERSRNVSNLDPDIAALKSWSMSVKIQEQRQRNLKREIERYHKMGKMEKAEMLFEKTTGFRWPW